MFRQATAALIFATIFISGCSDSEQPSLKDPKTQQRLQDLDNVKAALEKYHEKEGAYPVSKGFDGFPSEWGNSTRNWIAGLSPTYISELPLDPDHEAPTPGQYLYSSNGTDYKLIAHRTSDCEAVKAVRPELMDLQRQCYAYGYWTAGARNW